MFSKKSAHVDEGGPEELFSEGSLDTIDTALPQPGTKTSPQLGQWVTIITAWILALGLLGILLYQLLGGWSSQSSPVKAGTNPVPVTAALTEVPQVGLGDTGTKANRLLSTPPEAGSVRVAENTAAVMSLSATGTGMSGKRLSYRIAGTGADDSHFSIDASGHLSFAVAPDFEHPIDADGDNRYRVDVAISDGTDTITQSHQVLVTSVNDNTPVITSPGMAAVAENSLPVLVVTASDADLPADEFTFSLAGTGTDDALFRIDAGGQLGFLIAPDYEQPADAGADNHYVVNIQVSDGINVSHQSLSIAVTPVNDNPPVIGSADRIEIAEQTTRVLTVMATDADVPADGFTYKLSGSGEDDARFSIDASGNLSFTTAPDFESPLDVYGDNEYVVDVAVSDGANSTRQNILVAVTPVNDNAPVITSPATASVEENITRVQTLSATDTDVPPDSLIYAIAGIGKDDALFTVDADGQLEFLSAPDYESPADADADNRYLVSLDVFDGYNTTSQTLIVSVTPANDNAPVVTSPDTASVVEKTTSVLTISVTDPDRPAQDFTYSLAGSGADDAHFSIDASGHLSFAVPPDFEAPIDADADNRYEVAVDVSDGVHISSRRMTVTVTPANDNTPLITSAGTVNVAENTTRVITVTASDADLPADSFTYTLAGSGADDELFGIDAGGNLSFLAPPDYERPADADADNQYVASIQVSDGVNTTLQILTIAVMPANDNHPVFTSADSASVAENSAGVLPVTVSDTDLPGDTASFSIAGSGADDALFGIDASGYLSFLEAPDYEAPRDANDDNRYIVDVAVSDGTNSTIQSVTVAVTPVNDNAPVVTSAETASVAENSAAVQQLTITDADLPGDSTTWSIAGSGADDALFGIDTRGRLSFTTTPDYELPADTDGDNRYVVDVAVFDGENTTIQTVIVAVTPVNDNAPLITSTEEASVVENTATVQAITITDADLPGDSATWSIAGSGADDALFVIDGRGGLSFSGAPDYENPRDADRDNRYVVDVAVFDGTNTTTQTVTVAVTAANDNVPVITSPESVEVVENTPAVQLVTVSDADLPADSIIYTIAGSGADDARFTINAGGQLSFREAPDYEHPLDANGDNVYVLDLDVFDGNNVTTRTMKITVTAANDNVPVFTSAGALSVAENTTETYRVTMSDADLPGDNITWSLAGSGADDRRFRIDADGNIVFRKAPDYEKPLDADHDNVYVTDVKVFDGANSVTHTVTFTVNPVNDNLPVITSAKVASVTENTPAVHQVTITDADLPGDDITYSLAGSGVDDAQFVIDPAGNLAFSKAPDFEKPLDADSDNVYAIDVAVNDGGNTVTQNVTVKVKPVNDNVMVITSAAQASLAENTAEPYPVTVTDVDLPGDKITYQLTGAGADDRRFRIDAGGKLRFRKAPDYEKPRDADADNRYHVDVEVLDGEHASSQTLTFVVTPVNDNAPVFTGPDVASVAENTVVVAPVTISDADLPGDSIAYRLTGNGADDALFTIDDGGNLAFLHAPDYESPADADGNNRYVVDMEVSDGVHTATRTMSVNVTPLNDNAPVITNLGANNLLTVEDADVPVDTITYRISGTGADDAHFSIDASGRLRFNSAPDYHNPLDADRDNQYDVDVQVSDGINATTQTISVTVTPTDPRINDRKPPVLVHNSGAVLDEGGRVVITKNELEWSDAQARSDISYTLTHATASGQLEFAAKPGKAVSRFTQQDIDKNRLIYVHDGSEVTQDSFEFDVDDGQGNTLGGQRFTLKMRQVNDNPPLVTSPANVSVEEESTRVLTLTALDTDLPGDSFSYRLAGTGEDDVHFRLDAGGNLVFSRAPDFELPADADSDNRYAVDVAVSDGVNTTIQNLTVTVTPRNDNAPQITSSSSISMPEKTTRVLTVIALDTDLPGDTLRYSLAGTGADDAHFRIDASGRLDFIRAPLYGSPRDADQDNEYIVDVAVSDGVNTTTRTLTVMLTPVQDSAPVITAPDTFTVEEGRSRVAIITATDQDLPAQSLAYVITGGADQGKFLLNGTSGELMFLSVPDFEAPGDADGDNIYELEVTASDDADTSTKQAFRIIVVNGNEAPSRVNISNISIDENIDTSGGYPVGRLSTSDPDAGDRFTYSIVGGADSARFRIGGASADELHLDDGLLDFERKRDYQIIVRSADAGGLRDYETLGIMVNNLNDIPLIRPVTFLLDSEYLNGTVIGRVKASDRDPGDRLRYSIIAGNRNGALAIDAATGRLTVANSAALDAAVKPSHNFTVRVTDMGGLSAEAIVTISLAGTAPVPVDSAAYEQPEMQPVAYEADTGTAPSGSAPAAGADEAGKVREGAEGSSINQFDSTELLNYLGH